MYILVSHILAYISLTVGAIYDLKTSEVPDTVSVIGVVGGIALHLMASYSSGMDINRLLNFSYLLNEPLFWIQALGDPLMWSLGVGIMFSIFGWGLYFLGLWGGADAFAMSVLGFAAPTAIGTFSSLHSVNLFINITIVGLLYSIGFAIYKSWGTGAINQTYENIKQNEEIYVLAVVSVAIISVFGGVLGSLQPLAYFIFFVSLIFLYQYLKVIQDDIMTEEIPVEDLEGGEVMAKGQLDDNKVRGIREEEIEDLDSEKVEIREGVRFIPVFPVALLITDIFGGGIFFIQFLIS